MWSLCNQISESVVQEYTDKIGDFTAVIYGLLMGRLCILKKESPPFWTEQWYEF